MTFMNFGLPPNDASDERTCLSENGTSVRRKRIGFKARANRPAVTVMKTCSGEQRQVFVRLIEARRTISTRLKFVVVAGLRSPVLVSNLTPFREARRRKAVLQ